MTLAGTAGGRLIDLLAKIGFATFALKEAVGVVQAAWNGFFNNTIGREIQLRETILKTQTTLASTNKVFADGREITDPYQKIVTLTGAVAERIDSIRERSIALAGVTSNEVIEVFGIVASQVGQIGGGLKDAEDLAINFAAALGTFGIPLYQARQEIGSILRGQITDDSLLATSLLISNDDIARAKTQAGGVVKFLEDRLAAAVAGQKIAAEGFAGVVSNIADLGELIGQNFGRGLLDPLIAGLTSVFETLFRIRQQLFDIASGAGRAIGTAGRLVVGLTAGRTGLGAGNPEALARSATAAAERGFQQIEQVAQRTVGAITQAVEALKPTALILVDAFKNIAEAFVRIKVGSFEALASALANIATVVGAIAQPLATVFNLYSRFLNTPAVRYFSEVAAVLGLLKRVGLDAVTQLVLFGRFIFGSIIPAIGGLGTALGGLVGAIAAVILAVGKLLVVFAGLATALVGPAAAIPALAAGLKALGVELLSVGKQAVTSGTELNGLAAGFRGLGAGAKAAGASILASLGWVAVLQIGVAALVDAFGRYQRAQEDKRSSERAAEALRRLQTTYKDVKDSADSATKAAHDFELALVNAEYDKGINRLEELRNELNDLRYEAKEGIQTWNEFFRVVGAAGQVDPLGTGLSKEAAKRLAEEAQIRKRLKEIDATRDREQAWRDIQLEAANRVNLEKEIGELRRQIDNDLFQQRQALAQKEVEIFRAAGELRIKQIERANEKLIEGEEGASRAALEALNNYIATRERGELEIEAAKKSLAIEVTNLEKAISDYRYDIEKKIAELRKKSADYERNAVDARQRAAGGAGAPATGPAGALSQLIGAHESYGGNYGAYNRGGSNQGRTAHGSGIDPNLVNMTIAEIQRRQLAPGVPANQQLHAVGKYQIIGPTLRGLLAGSYGETGVTASDKFTPAVQDKLFAALARGRVIPGDVAATERGLKQQWIGLQKADPAALRAAVQQLMGGAAPAAAPAATAGAAGAAGDIPDATEAADNYAAAVRNLAGAMERFRALQEAITSADTAAAFDRIAQAFFPRAQLEQYEDRLNEVRFTYDAVAASSVEAFNPERSAIEVARLAQLAGAARELEQVQKGIADKVKAGQLNETERAKAIDAINARYKQHLRDVEQEATFKQRILATEQATALITQLRNQARDVRADIEALQLRNRLEAEGVAPEFIQAELAKLNIQREVNRFTDEQNQLLETQITLRDQLQQQLATATDAEKPELEKQLTAALATIERLREQLKAAGAAGASAAAAEDARARAATEPGTRIRSFIGAAKRELQDYEGMAIRVSQNIGDAIGSSLENGITGLIEGTTTAKEVFANFLKDVSQILLREGTKMIATYIAIGIAKQFAGLFPQSNVAKNFEIPNAAFIPEGGFKFPGAANGAYFDGGVSYFANGGIVSSPTLFQFSSGGADEAPFQLGVMGEAGPEAIMPLERGPDGRLGVRASGYSSSGEAIKTQMRETLEQALPFVLAKSEQRSDTTENAESIKSSEVSVVDPAALKALGELSQPYQPSADLAVPFQQVDNSDSTSNQAQSTDALMSSLPLSERIRESREVMLPLSERIRESREVMLPLSERIRESREVMLPFTRTAEQATMVAAERETAQAIANPGPLDVRFESQVINGVEYITADQHRKGMKEAAERGRALTLQALQNSVRTRGRVGL